MNICIVSTEGRATKGGLPVYTRLLARHLRDAGHAVSSVARFDRPLPGPLDYSAENDVSGGTIDGIPTRLVRPLRITKRVLRRLKHGMARRPLRASAIGMFCFAYKRSIHAAVPKNIDVLHYVGTGWELFGFAALREARRQGAAFTIWPAVHPETWGDSPVDIRLYNQADAVFCQSDEEVRHLIRLGVESKRLTRAWLASASESSGDARRFREKNRLQGRLLILFIGRKCKSKGFHALCEAMKTIAAEIPAACLIAIGPTAEPPFPAVPASAYLDLGVADEAEKADALAACDVFCMPSSAESFGIVYIEAWAYAKPVVGGPAPAVKELVEEDVTGFTVEQDSQQIAAVLLRLLRDPAQRQRLGEAGQKIVQSRYNWPSVIGLHMAVFHRVVDQRTKK